MDESEDEGVNETYDSSDLDNGAGEGQETGFADDSSNEGDAPGSSAQAPKSQAQAQDENMDVDEGASGPATSASANSGKAEASASVGNGSGKGNGSTAMNSDSAKEAAPIETKVKNIESADEGKDEVKTEGTGEHSDTAVEEEDLDGEGEEDPVEHSFDLYLSREMEEQLYMLRYPLRSVTREPPRVSSARFKPRNQVLETTVDVLNAFHGDDPNGNPSFELPPHVEHMTDHEQREYMEKVRKQSFRSVRLNTHERCYAAAVVDKATNRVTLVPLQGIYDMMPIIQTGFESQDGPIDDEEIPGVATMRSSSTAVAMAQPVGLQREANYDPNRQRFAKVKQQLDEESWVDLDVHERDSAQASEAFAELRYKAPHDVSLEAWVDEMSDAEQANEQTAQKGPGRSKGAVAAREAFKLSSGDYLDVLAPKIRRDRESIPDPEATPSDKPQTIEDHLRAQLIKQGVMTTEMMEGSLTRAFGNLETKTLRSLPEKLSVVAHLVHGAWYLRSDIYNEHRFGISQSGDDLADHQRNWTRNVILAIFAEHPKGQVSRAAIAKEVKGVVASSMLESVAVYNGEKRLWQLLRIDEKYQGRNAALAARHRSELRGLHCDALQRLSGWSQERAFKAAFPGEKFTPGAIKEEDHHYHHQQQQHQDGEEPMPPRASSSSGASSSRPKVKFED
ncbi:DNA-directed RNA polymerase III subunit RPC5 [Hondaea fermentalgiana]|uniref:DNA-directed RNA polymerase III subunit RPC5 n=1 Tax=Hondaea fermentalgiana TaxID=2315210 RepID=A0A2R5GGX9_9STRA|nr:DNA-directed RNA polymerase III subunit RPC5 [Hondaea fermentalgiana]|eukprot:GBG29855.1 DNA-directed RNA polymerase III subunit RPC5 [Hondaea fermentalgiana]